jgi:serine phosphatase RsbU (regulator of sigma subunit)
VQLAVDRLSPGDRLLFFSDGVVDARAPNGEPFGDQNLADLLQKRSLDGMSSAETMRRLLHAVVGHHGSQLTDDATMVMVEWRGESGA